MKSENLDFDGMSGNGVNRAGNKYAGNHHTKTNADALINKGRGPTKGNQDHKATGGPSATRDAYRPAPTSALPAITTGKDMFTGKPQVRTPGGTRAWDPKAGQNYKGNPDQIRVGQSGGPGYGAATRGGNPEQGTAKSDSFNYGPKSQY